MKKILLAIGFFIALTTEAQVVNKFRDSSVFFKGVRFDSTLQFKRLKTAAEKDSILVISDANGTLAKINKSTFYNEFPVYVQTDSVTVNAYDVLNSQNAPPGSPATGDTYLVGTSPTGAWVGHAKDIAEWNGSAWVFTDGVQGDFLYNATTALTYIFRSGNWVQTTGIPALNNGNTISSGLKIGTNNARSLTFETNNVNRGRFDSVGRFHIYNLPTSSTSDTFVTKSDLSGKLTKVGESTFLSGVNTDAQTLTAGVNTLTISGGNTVDLNRKVDTSYSFRNASLDSICQIVIINGNPTRSCIKDSTGGGGAGSISALTAASSINNIFNTNYKQRWNWNTLAGDTAFVLASNSTAAASNLQTLFSVNQSGANATSTQTTYGGIFSNTKTGTTSTNIGGLFVASGANNNYAIEAQSEIKVKNTSTGIRQISFWSGTTENARIGNINGVSSIENLDLSVNQGGSIVFRTSTGTGIGSEKVRIRNSGALCVNTTGGDSYALNIQKGSFSDAAYIGTGNLVMEGGTAVKFNFINQKLMSDADGVSITDNTLSKVFTIATSGNIGIGTVTPNSSARLDIQSTVQGFLLPRLTTVQRDAIATPATGLTLFCTDCTATDASTGVMQTYNGATWKNFW